MLVLARLLLRRCHRVGEVFVHGFPACDEPPARVSTLPIAIKPKGDGPDVLASHDHWQVRFNSHAVGDIAEDDVFCATRADAVFVQQFGTAAA